jgi:hypothetical protein
MTRAPRAWPQVRRHVLVEALGHVEQRRRRVGEVGHDERHLAGVQAGAVVEPRADVRADALLPALQDNRSHFSSSLELVLYALVGIELGFIQLEWGGTTVFIPNIQTGSRVCWKISTRLF